MTFFVMSHEGMTSYVKQVSLESVNTETHTQTGPILLPRPLMREVINMVVAVEGEFWNIICSTHPPEDPKWDRA